MIQFPEAAQAEWRTAAAIAEAPAKVRQRIERGTAVENAVERLRVMHEAKALFQQELDADATPTLEMTTLLEYSQNPSMAPADLIEGVMKRDGLCVVLGPSGSGKSTLGLQMLHSLASGEDWLGQPVTPLSGGIGVLSYDMDASMVLDWMLGFPDVDPSKVNVVNAYRRGNPLGVPAIRQQIAAAWRAANTEVVVIDSFSASFFGLDQNDAGATMAHYRDLKLFALTEVGAQVLVVIVHSAPNAPLRARGSTVHHDVADTIVGMEVLPTQERKVSMVKYRAARGQRMMDPVIITPPDDVTHLVELDLGAMSLAGLRLPPGAAFTPLPNPTTAPVTDSDEEDDDL